MSVPGDGEKRVRSMTEKGKEYNLNLFLDKANKLLVKSKQEIAIAGVLFETPDASRGVLCVSLSELSLKITQLTEIKERPVNITKEDMPILIDIQEMLAQLNSFIKQKSSNIIKPNDSGSSRHGSIGSRHSSTLSGSSEVSMRLRAKLKLVERAHQLRIREAKLDLERAEVEAEVNKTRLLSEAVNDQDFQGEDLTKLLIDLEVNDTTAQTSRAITNHIELPQITTSVLMPQNPTMLPESYKATKIEHIPRTDYDINLHSTGKNIPISLPNAKSQIIPTSKSNESKFTPTAHCSQCIEQTQTRSWTDPTVLFTKIQILNSLVPFKFSGQYETFPIFRCHIRTHLEDGILPDNEKIVFLSKFLEGEALRVFQTNIGLSYNDAVSLLERRFGNYAAVTEAWVKRLSEGPPISIYDPKAMLEFSEDLATSSRVLTENARKEISTKVCLKRIVSRLPKKYLPGWISLVEPKDGTETIDDLAEYVKGVARTLNHPVYDMRGDAKQIKSISSEKRYSAAKGFRNLTNDSTTEPALEVKPVEPSNNAAKPITSSADMTPRCRFCESTHSLSECPVFAKETIAQIRYFVQTQGLCYSCLFPGHISRHCKQRARCKIPSCNKVHPTSLHTYRTPSKSQQENTTNTYFSA